MPKKKKLGQPEKPAAEKKTILLQIYTSPSEVKRSFGTPEKAREALKDAWAGMIGLPRQN
jgi:hypothetical protein